MKKLKLLLFIHLLFLSPYNIFSQHCGSHKLGFKTNYDILYPERQISVMDRFGNEFNKLLSDYVNNNSTSTSIPNYTMNFPNGSNFIYYDKVCDAGIFRIYFAQDDPNYGFDFSVNRNAVCQVFKDLSVLINHSNPTLNKQVKIYIASDKRYTSIFQDTMDSTKLTIASPMYVIHKNAKNAILESEAVKTIKLGDNSFKNLPFPSLQNNTYMYNTHYIHGYIVVNFDKFNWNSDYRTSSIGANEYDLYTNILHEALHILGMNSFIDSNGNSIVSEGIYAYYDKLLKKGTTPLISYNSSLNKWLYTGGLPYLANGCNNATSNTINFSGANLTNQSVYTVQPFEKDKSLSHFSCLGDTCTNYAAPSNTYVSTYCRLPGNGFIKRRPHADEVKLLCDLGYTLNVKTGNPKYGDDSTNTTIYSSYLPCGFTAPKVIGVNDLFYTENKTPITILISDIIGNDITTAKVKLNHINLLTNGSGSITVNYTGGVPNSITYTPSSTFYGNAMIGYIPMSSSNVEGSLTYVTVVVARPFDYYCDEDNKCNLICNGDFENTSIPLYNWHWGIKRGMYTLSSVGFYLGNNFNWYNPTTNCPTGGLCNCNGAFWSPSVTQTLNVASNGGSRFASLLSQDESYLNPPQPLSNINEPNDFYISNTQQPDRPDGMMFFKLKEKLKIGTTYKLNFVAARAAPKWLYLPVKMNIYGSISKPCINNDCSSSIIGTRLDGTTSICGFKAIKLDNNNLNVSPTAWNAYTLQFTASDTMEYIVIYAVKCPDSVPDAPPSGFTPPKGYLAAVYIDNFELLDLSVKPILITATQAKNEFCIGGIHTINYSVKLATGAIGFNSNPIGLKVSIPLGFKVVLGGSFDSTGNLIIPTGSVSSSISKNYTISLISDTTILPDMVYSFGVKPYGNFCANDSSIVILKATARDFPLTIDKYVSPANGNNVSFNIKLCNKRNYTISNAIILDTLVSNIQAIGLNGYTLTGNVLTKSISIGAKPTIGDTCQSHSFTAYVSNCEPVTNCTRVRLVNHVCSEIYKSCVTVNKDTNYTVSILGQDSICANSTLKLKSIVSTGSEPYTYQWYYNNSLLVGETKDSLEVAGNQGIYRLDVTNSIGCVSKVYKSISFFKSIALTRDSTKHNCNDSSSAGTIELYINYGKAPLSFLWSDMVTTQNRTGLAVGTYSVTISDANGCAISKTYTIYKSSRIAATATIQNARCNLSTGSIALSVNGGKKPYIYKWKNRASNQDTISGLSVGNYYVTVTDSNGCSLIDSFKVNKIYVNLDAYIMSGCVINNLTNVKAYVSEGDAPFTYMWNTGSTDSFINNVNAVTYPTIIVTVTDVTGCSVSVSKLISATTGTISIGTGTAYPTSNSMLGILSFGSTPTVLNKKFSVVGTFKVDQSTNFYNCDFEATPGSKIVVDNSIYPTNAYNYTSFAGCHFYTCGEQLWKGIELKHQWGISAGGLVMWASLLEDALYGVEVYSGPITGYDFTTKNCFIGLLNRDNVGTSFWRKMTFYGKDTNKIKLPYSTINNDFYSMTHDTVFKMSRKSFCGVEYNDVAYAYSNDAHSFYQLTNGIIFNNVYSAHVDQSYFENMLYDNNLKYKNLPSGLPMHLNSGAAIILNNPNRLGGGTVYVNGTDFNHTFIKSCRYGVVGNQGGHISISNMRMDSIWGTGIYGNYSTIKATINYIHSLSYGIRQEVSGWSGTNTNTGFIDNNYIKTDNVGIGIYSNTSSASSYSGTVSNNVIEFQNKGNYGLDVMNINDLFVASNYVDATIPNPIYVGYNYENSLSISESMNTAISSAGNRLKTRVDSRGNPIPFPVGFYYNFTEHLANCNYANHLKIGVRYTGLCNNSELVGTSINNHDIGIKIDNTAILKDQVNNGNAFLDTCNFEVRSDQLSAATLTTFFVNTSAPAYFWASPRFPSSTKLDIFSGNTGADNTDCNIPLPPQAPDEGAALRDKIRLSLLEYPEFEPQMLWQNQSWLYDYLQTKDTLTSDEQDYLDAMAGTNIEKLNQLTDEEKQLYQRSLARLEQIESLENALKINANLLLDYSTILTDTMTTDQFSAYKIQVKSVQNNLRVQDSLLQNLYQMDITQAGLHLDTMTNTNSLLVPELITDSLQQVFNAIYYTTIAEGQYELSPAQMATFQFLAHRCPLLNADVVFRSRAIVQSYSDTLRRYDDAEICIAEGYEYKNQRYKKPLVKKTELVCEVYPNPAKTYTIIKFNYIPIDRVYITISDLLGRTIYQYTDTLNTNNFEINTSSLSSGVYLVSVSTQEKLILNTKLKIDNQ